MKEKKTTAKARAKKGPSVGARIIEGLEEAVAFAKHPESVEDVLKDLG